MMKLQRQKQQQLSSGRNSTIHAVVLVTAAAIAAATVARTTTVSAAAWISTTATTSSRSRRQRWCSISFSRSSSQQQQQQQRQQQRPKPFLSLSSSSPNDNDSDSSSFWDEAISKDSNRWRSTDDDPALNGQGGAGAGGDWLDILASKQDGTFWSSFESSASETESETAAAASRNKGTGATAADEDDEWGAADAWLDTLAMLSATEVEFNQKEAERAELARKMEEYKFSPEIIASALGVATDTSLEDAQEVQGMKEYRQQAYQKNPLDDIDLETVESHTMVEKDPETKEPIRTQMVYVDEHTCIGCTNCAMIAQSTFFMHSEHGRARVFQQWGDDEETIQIAIETCPVDCIHYIPYDELVRLEQERRDQNINFKARLVNQGEYGISGGGGGTQYGAGARFTAPQRISGNMGARCNNCPSRGCRDCPMYGVGKNPEFERKEQARKERMERNRLQKERQAQSKRAEL